MEPIFEGFDLSEKAYSRMIAIYNHDLKKGVAMKKLYRLFGALYSLNKSETRKLLRALCNKYSLKMNYRGVRYA